MSLLIARIIHYRCTGLNLRIKIDNLIIVAYPLYFITNTLHWIDCDQKVRSITINTMTSIVFHPDGKHEIIDIDKKNPDHEKYQDNHYMGSVDK